MLHMLPFQQARSRHAFLDGAAFFQRLLNAEELLPFTLKDLGVGTLLRAASDSKRKGQKCWIMGHWVMTFPVYGTY